MINFNSVDSVSWHVYGFDGFGIWSKCFVRIKDKEGLIYEYPFYVRKLGCFGYSEFMRSNRYKDVRRAMNKVYNLLDLTPQDTIEYLKDHTSTEDKVTPMVNLARKKTGYKEQYSNEETLEFIF